MAAAAQVLTDAIWSWYTLPGPVYVSGANAFYWTWVGHQGDVRVGKYNLTTKQVQQATLHGALQEDDHDFGAVLPMASGNLLTVYGPHGSPPLYTRASTSANNVMGWGAETSFATADNDSFAMLWQSADTAATVWNFSQRQQGSSPGYTLAYYTSTNGGSTWSAYTDFWISSAGTSNISLMRMAANGPNHIDILTSNGHPQEAGGVSLYHFYMTVNSSGVPSFFNSTGTSLGSSLPFSAATANMTLVYDGTTTGSIVWDLKIIGGQPVGVFAIFPNAAGAIVTDTTGEQIQYYQAAFNGTTWSTSLIAEAGSAWNSGARQDWLYAGQQCYVPGICLDPNNASIVYLSKTYGGTAGVGAGDCRLEQWTKSLFQKPMLWSVSVVACTETDPGTSPRSADGASTESC